MIRIAIFTDPHQNYKDLDEVLFDINQAQGLDFVAGLGDYTNSGYNLEYDQFISALDSVKAPRIMAIGNHDSVGSGPELFAKAFGPANFYFESSTHRYIFFNGNNWENPEAFDPSWLKAAVDGTTKKVFIFSHVQLLDTERYKDDVLTTMQGIVNDPKVQLALNGHNHIYNLVVSNNTILLQVGRTQGHHWVILEIQGNNLCIKRMDTMETDCRTLK
jgi:predicted phosphodiesterase